MERALAARGTHYESHDYAGTMHWFAELDNPAYDQAATDLAVGRTVAFLDRWTGPDS